MDKKTVIEQVRKFSDVVKDNFPVKMVILYGSYVLCKRNSGRR